MSSKHLQTRRLLSTLQAYLFEVRAMLVQLWREANEREEETFMDHAGVLRNARTGDPVSSEEDEPEDALRECHLCASLECWLTPSGRIRILRCERAGDCSPGKEAQTTSWQGAVHRRVLGGAGDCRRTISGIFSACIIRVTLLNMHCNDKWR